MNIDKLLKFSGFGWMQHGELMELFLPIGNGQNVGVNISIADAEKMPLKQLHKLIIKKTEQCYKERALAFFTQVKSFKLEDLKHRSSEDLQAMYLEFASVLD
jgi:hypothetical protein